MIHGYAITHRVEAEAALPRLGLGIEDAKLEIVSWGDLCALVTHHEQSLRRDLPTATQHQKSVEALWEIASSTLPLRLNSDFDEEAEVATILEQREKELQNLLEKVSGCAEIGIRVEHPSPKESTATSGRAYLEQLTAHEARRRELESWNTSMLGVLEENLGSAVRESISSLVEKGGFISRFTFLTPHGSINSAFDKLDRFARTYPDLVMYRVGPFPAYSFVEMSL